mgnify:CR=1 FL=1
MSCDLSMNYSFAGCKGGAGGINNVYMTELANVLGAGAPTVVAGVVTAWALPTGKQFRTWSLAEEMGSFTYPLTGSPETGNIFYENTIDFSIKKLSITNINEIDLIAKNYLCMMVEDVNSDVWVFGIKKGMELITASLDSGKLMADFNGQNLSFKGKAIEPIRKLGSGLLASLIVPAV